MSEVQRIQHCAHWGAFDVLVRDGRVVGVEPSPDDPLPSGIVQAVPEWVDPRHRVPAPMVREGWLRSRDKEGRGSDRFIEVDWPTALDLTANEITRVAQQHGNSSIFAGSYGWTSAGRFHHAATLLKRMLNLVGGYTGHVDTYSVGAGAVIVRHTLGSPDAYNGYGTSLDTIAEHGELLIVFGALSPRTAQSESGGLGSHRLVEALQAIARRGVRIVHISPSRDDLPSWLDAEWWPIRPNTDTALMLALAGEIVADDRHDKDFLARCCSGADEYLAYLEGKLDGTVKNAAWAAPIVGLPEQAIRDLGRAMTAQRAMVTVSWALQRAHRGEQPFWAALGLAAVSGNIGKRGGGVGYGYGSLGNVGIVDVSTKSPGMSEGRKPIQSFIPVARITDLLLNPGQEFTYEDKVLTYPDTRLVYWAGGNPFHHHQDLNRLRQAWQRPETIVVQEPFWTATARRADIVLPASTSLERNDLAGHRRSDRIIAMKKAVAPVGQSKADYEIFCALADRMGVMDAFTEGRNEMQWIERLYDLSRNDALEQGYGMPSFSEFWERGYAEVPVRKNLTHLESFAVSPRDHPLDTESGLIVLGSATVRGLELADFPSHPAWLEPVEWLGSATAERHGFHLLSQQPASRLHSQLDFADHSTSAKVKGIEVATLNAEDARELDIRRDDIVRLWNDRGSCLAAAQLSDQLRRSVVILPTGAWYRPVDESGNAMDAAGNPNVLTVDIASSSFGQGCSAQTCLVSVERYRGNLPDEAISEPQPAIVKTVAIGEVNRLRASRGR